MEAITKENKEAAAVQGKKKKSKWEMFMNFLAMGGLIVIVIAGLAIAVLISTLWK